MCEKSLKLERSRNEKIESKMEAIRDRGVGKQRIELRVALT